MATTKALARLGATVYVADFSKEPPAELRDVVNVNFTGGCDVSQREACKSFIDGIPGRLDGVVNCAGVSLLLSPLVAITDSDGTKDHHFGGQDSLG